MKIKEIINLLEEWAPSSYQESYDNSRLIVGDANTDCSGVLISLDCIESLVEEAIQKKCNMIVSHHPILFSGLKSLTGKTYVERTILKAIKNNIALYAIHTNLDNVFTGVNSKITEKLGLQNVRILAPKNDKTMLKFLLTYCPKADAHKVREAIFAVGGGEIGNYNSCSFSNDGTGTFRPLEGANPAIGKVGELELVTEEKIEIAFLPHQESAVIKALKSAHPYEEVAYQIVSTDNVIDNIGSGMIGNLLEPMEAKDIFNLIKDKFKVPFIKHTALTGKKVQRIAVCGGSGSFLLKNAINAGADIFLTADYKYHQFFDAENQIVIVDIGHYETEQFTPALIGDYLTKKNVNFAVHLSDINTNPINYF